MLTPDDILAKLDNCHESLYSHFITLNHPYVFLIDSRLNIFRGDDDKWAVAAEVLGYNPRGDIINIEIFYFGNCLVNLEWSDKHQRNSAWFYPIDYDHFNKTIEYEALKRNAKEWIVRGTPVPLSHKKKDYTNAGIELQEYEPREIRIEEAARLAIINHAGLFRATDEELHKSIPAGLDKILVLDEWHHREFSQSPSVFDNPERLKMFDLTDEFIQNMIKEEKARTAAHNLEEWENNRPGSYETWQQLAQVIATSDVSFYKPTLPPNSHWTNWPESGGL